MTTVIALFEVYKTLPKRSRKVLKELIETEESKSILMSEIEEGLKQIKQIRDGKIKPKSIKEVLHG
ncbi:MAG: hypothetical protein RLZZ306_2434 [Bacteroidota bacterium]|jgi:hypothetical protein